MSAFESMIVIKHALKLKYKYGTKKAAEYLALNNVNIEVALFLVAGK